VQNILDSTQLGYSRIGLKLFTLVDGNDTFVSLPTGYEKSLTLLLFDKLRGKDSDC